MVRLESSNLIGKMMVVLESTNKTIVGLEGRILLESAKTITLELPSGVHNAVLKSALGLVRVEGQDFVGSELLAGAQDRIRGN